MTVTKEQAMEGGTFHFAASCTPQRVERWRASGRCQTWKTRPDEFRLPVKFGLRSSHAITELNAHEFHREQDCPIGRESEPVHDEESE